MAETLLRVDENISQVIVGIFFIVLIFLSLLSRLAANLAISGCRSFANGSRRAEGWRRRKRETARNPPTTTLNSVYAPIDIEKRFFSWRNKKAILNPVMPIASYSCNNLHKLDLSFSDKLDSILRLRFCRPLPRSDLGFCVLRRESFHPSHGANLYCIIIH